MVSRVYGVEGRKDGYGRKERRMDTKEERRERSVSKERRGRKFA
jgi:hypothetical protein